MDYAAGGVGGALADDVRAWCRKGGDNKAAAHRVVRALEATNCCNTMARSHGWRAGCKSPRTVETTPADAGVIRISHTIRTVRAVCI